MEERTESGGGFTLLDGAALVIGAAVASVHMREAVTSSLLPLGWGLVWITFTGVALSAAGPFIFLERRYGRRPPGYPRIGDYLWGLVGIPWILTALLRPSYPLGARASSLELYRLCLWLALGVVSFVVMAIVWRTWVAAGPGKGMRDGPLAWTERIGLILAVGWPLQCGFGLVVAE